MSKMYGNRRVVLEQKRPQLVVICGSAAPSQGGLYAPLGYWRKSGDGLFYVDLKSPDQFYDSVSKETIAHRDHGGFTSKAALRQYVMEYWLNQRNEQDANRKA
jgi:hypothetical protein